MIGVNETRVKSFIGYFCNMARLKTQGGVSEELMAQTKAAMLEENMDFAEAQEPSKRSGAGYPTITGYAEIYLNQGK